MPDIDQFQEAQSAMDQFQESRAEIKKYKRLLGYAAIMTAVFLGCMLFGWWFGPIGPADRTNYMPIIDSLKKDIHQAKAQRQIDEKVVKELRDEVSVLKAERVVLDYRIAENDDEIRTIKSKYEKIIHRYDNVPADSLRVLFAREFGD